MDVKNTAAPFWESILQFGYTIWELAGKFSKIIKTINSSVIVGPSAPKFKIN
jgi:hypothetical protein